MVAPLLGYVPLVLDSTVQADGFGAQILEIFQIDPGSASPVVPASFAPLTKLFSPNPSRKGKNQIVFSIQNADDGGSPPVPNPTGSIVIRLRSPFVYDLGSPVFAPTVQMIANPSDQLFGPVAQCKFDATLPPASGGLTTIASLADQNQNPSFGYSPTFQGKNIPNWSFFLGFNSMSETVGPPIYIIDWNASVSS